MYCTRKITDDLYYVGGSDRRLALFENIFPIPRGVSYNSYLLKDEKTVLFDTVDRAIGAQLIENVEGLLEGKKLDYLIINHMEPDHCSLIADILIRYPDVQIVGTGKTFTFIEQFFGLDIEKNRVVVGEGDTLTTGNHTLHFIMAPMVHWPEVMVTFDEKDQVLFSADAFGSFGALGGTIFNDEMDFDRDWLDDARRYYTNIVGKYGTPVQTLLNKACAFDIKYICPLHGPVWRNNIPYFVEKHCKWSKYEAEEKGVVIAYASMYGNTENCATILACELAELGVPNIKMYDVSNTNVSYLISEVFKFTHVVLASPTYNLELYPVMDHFVKDMKALNVQNKTVAVIENGTWAPAAGKKMNEILESMKNITCLEHNISLRSTVKPEDSKNLKVLAEEIKKSMDEITL